MNHRVMFASVLNCRCYIGQDIIKKIIIYLRKKVKLANVKMKMCEDEKMLSLKNGESVVASVSFSASRLLYLHPEVELTFKIFNTTMF